MLQTNEIKSIRTRSESMAKKIDFRFLQVTLKKWFQFQFAHLSSSDSLALCIVHIVLLHDPLVETIQSSFPNQQHAEKGNKQTKG